MFQNKYIYVKESIYSSYGVKVIVNRLIEKIDGLQLIHDLNEAPPSSYIIPYGILEPSEVLNKKCFAFETALLIDSYSLGEWSNFAKYAFKAYIPLVYRIKCLLRAIKFFYLEYRIFSSYKKIMLVSWGDKKYYEDSIIFSRFAKKIVVIPNGVSIPVINNRKASADNVLRIGCLSPWGGPSFYTLQYFLNEVWSKMSNHNNMELIIAGWGITDEKRDYLEKFPNIKVIGAVEKLEEFYDNIDVSLVTMLKKCGIINRVLDGFSYKVPVLARPESLLAFKNLPDCCYTYSDVKSFEVAIKEIRTNPSLAKDKAEKAFKFVSENHNWDKNYSNVYKDLF